MSDIEQSSIIYETDRLFLRGVSKNDIQGNYFRWFDDQEVCQYNSHGLFPNTMTAMESFLDSLATSQNAVVWAMIEKESKTHIGNISLQEINWINRTAEFSIIIGEKQSWGKGIAAEAAKILLFHGFQKLNLHRIYCGTAENNKGMKNLALKIGMSEEGSRKKALFFNGQYQDLIEYGILREDFLTKNES